LIWSLPFAVGDMQRDFISHGFLLRGAVCAGRLLHFGEIDSSVSYKDLAVHEAQCAIVPRVLFDVEGELGEQDDREEDAFGDVAGAHMRVWEGAGWPGIDADRILAGDVDGRLFVEYLLPVWRSDEFMSVHKQVVMDHIADATARGNKKALQKLFWLVRYHNVSLIRGDESSWWYYQAIEAQNTGGAYGEEGEDRTHLMIDVSGFPSDITDPVAGGRDQGICVSTV
jgi:hypothetical protein